MSSNGAYQTATVNGGSIYTSSDSGVTWTANTSAHSTTWSLVSVSSSGMYQIASNSSSTFISLNYGVTWTSSLQYSYRSVAISSTGEYVTGVNSNGIYRSSITLTADSYPGLMFGSYSDIFSDFTVDLGAVGPTGNFGMNWITTNTSIGTKNWTCISLSASGQYQTAGVANDFIYISNDYGNTWTQTASSLNWNRVSISSSGQYQTAVVYGGYIYISSDYGNTWTQKASSLNWRGVSISASGQYQTACTDNLNNGYIYTSSDYGNTWKQVSEYGNWYSVTVSASGQYQTAVEGNGDLFISSDYGNTWTKSPISNSSYAWYSVSQSASGQYQTASSNLGTYRSFDYGKTWTLVSSLDFSTISISASGQYQLATNRSGNLHVRLSSDYGKTWTGISISASGISISASGQYITCVVSGGFIYTCRNSVAANNAVIQVGGYTSGSGVTGVVGSLYYDTTLSGLRVTSGTTWSYVGFVGTTALGATGSLYYDTTQTAGATALLVSSGTGWTSVKSFVIEHPINTEKLLVHGCLEGPEAGVYYRGESEITNNVEVTIELPHYVDKFATNLTVQVTPIYNGVVKTLNVSKVKDNTFTVYGENCEFFWTVFGKRLSLDVEPNKKDVVVKGDGPYKWI